MMVYPMRGRKLVWRRLGCSLIDPDNKKIISNIVIMIIDHPHYQMYHQQVVFDDRWKTLMSKRSRLTKTSSMTLIMVCLFGDHHPHHPPHHHHHIIIIIKCIITIHYQAFTSLTWDQFADNLWSNVNMNQPRKCLPLAPWMYVYTPLASPLSSPL